MCRIISIIFSENAIHLGFKNVDSQLTCWMSTDSQRTQANLAKAITPSINPLRTAQPKWHVWCVMTKIVLMEHMCLCPTRMCYFQIPAPPNQCWKTCYRDYEKKRFHLVMKSQVFDNMSQYMEMFRIRDMFACGQKSVSQSELSPTLIRGEEVEHLSSFMWHSSIVLHCFILRINLNVSNVLVHPQ